ncbi:energy transducer TonB [Burkholderia lata]|uniref:energy transducer TonB n=1 Tax=Burkholderia lata (strain ATCC 17760 / DSM 23089 / LMG 22485 / NCIMB 9086 / R18194 / 383) TaxID=482957 RepID=UPI00399A266B
MRSGERLLTTRDEHDCEGERRGVARGKPERSIRIPLHVVAARVVTGSGYPRLDAAARETALASRCTPYVENGAPPPMRARVPVTFNLDE